MKPYRAWKGALELTINDVPLAVSVEFWSRVKKQRNESFRVLAPSGQPRLTQSVDPTTGEPYDDSLNRKGVKVADGFVPLTPEAVEKIGEGEKTQVIPTEAFCPLDTIALDLSIDRFAVRPQEDVAGSSDALNIVWNGLRETQLAWVAQVSLRGGHDAILAIYADSTGLWAALLPFESECYPTPTFHFTENDKAATLFAQMIEQEHEVKAFDYSSYTSEYQTRRQAAIQAVLDNKPITVKSPPKAKEQKVDLLAVLEASNKKKPAKKAKKKKAA